MSFLHSHVSMGQMMFNGEEKIVKTVEPDVGATVLCDASQPSLEAWKYCMESHNPGNS